MCKILAAEEIKPHKVRYYLEKRDAEFEEKLAEVLCVYRQVKILKEKAAKAETPSGSQVAIVHYDEKPGIQAIENTAPTFRPCPACIRLSPGITNTTATVPRASWLASIC